MGWGRTLEASGEVDAVAMDTESERRDGAGAGGETGCLLLALPASISGLFPCPRVPGAEQAVSCAPAGVSGSFLARGSSDPEVELLGPSPGHRGHHSLGVSWAPWGFQQHPWSYPLDARNIPSCDSDTCPLGELQDHPQVRTPVLL